MNPNEDFPARIPVEILLSCLLVLVITANICVFFKGKVYQNFNSSSILVCLTILQILRLITFMHRLIQNKNVIDDWVWNRVVTDLTNYFLGVVSVILFAQWY